MLLCFITLKGCVTNIGQLAAASAAGADLSMWSASQISSEWFGWWLFIVSIIIIVASQLGMLDVLDMETYFFFLLHVFECLHAFRASAAHFSPLVLPDKQKCSDNKMQKVPGWGLDDEALMSGVTEPRAVNTIITSLVSDTIMSRATQWPRISLWYDVIHNIFRDWAAVIKV